MKLPAVFGGRFIVINVQSLALKLAGLFSAEEISRGVGVGGSGAEFAKLINPNRQIIGVSTIQFDSARENRQLQVEAKGFDFRPVLFDDVAVSGLTLRIVRNALAANTQAVGAGMLFDNKTTRLRIGVDDVRAALIYSRQKGGNPAINSVSKLRDDEARLDQLAERYFSGNQQLKMLIKGDI